MLEAHGELPQDELDRLLVKFREVIKFDRVDPAPSIGATTGSRGGGHPTRAGVTAEIERTVRGQREPRLVRYDAPGAR